MGLIIPDLIEIFYKYLENKHFSDVASSPNRGDLSVFARPGE